MSQPRHAVVTGTSSGIGLAIAQALLAKGWRVSGLDRDPAVISEAGFTAHAIDLSAPEQVSTQARSLGTADALVHAAGVMRTGRLGALPLEAGAEMWRLHVEAATRLAEALLPGMPDGGRVVLIGSRAAAGIAGRSQYAATKAALLGLARSWAAELIERGITVNVISPAATDTAMLRDPARAGTAPKLPPLGRLIRPKEVAALAAYLLSEDAAAITGQDIAICGGASLQR
jgi:NAD(P)-dependent dehydrogenase (short-subunit alcohol dehydrogenase family)